MGGYARDAVSHLREASNRVAAIAQSLAAYPPEQALNIYNALAAANDAQQQAIIIFGAPGPASPVPGNPRPLVHVGEVPQEAARVLCPRMSEVQKRVDLAAQWVTRNYTGLSPQQYGTAVHYNVQQQIRNLNNPNFRSKVSLIKGDEETYGTPGSFRIDVLEKVNSLTLCVYDIKTGRSGLGPGRQREIANSAFKDFGQNFPIVVVTEIRPVK